MMDEKTHFGVLVMCSNPFFGCSKFECLLVLKWLKPEPPTLFKKKRRLYYSGHLNVPPKGDSYPCIQFALTESSRISRERRIYDRQHSNPRVIKKCAVVTPLSEKTLGSGD